MKTYSLLIWELIPEDTTMYLIPNDEADKIRHHLDQAHRCIINVSDMNPGLEFLNLELSASVSDVDSNLPEREGILIQYRWKYETGYLPVGIVVTHVYHSGFYL